LISFYLRWKHKLRMKLVGLDHNSDFGVILLILVEGSDFVLIILILVKGSDFEWIQVQSVDVCDYGLSSV
jgi:hypothetical protein